MHQKHSTALLLEKISGKILHIEDISYFCKENILSNDDSNDNN